VHQRHKRAPNALLEKGALFGEELGMLSTTQLSEEEQNHQRAKANARDSTHSMFLLALEMPNSGMQSGVGPFRKSESDFCVIWKDAIHLA
jgi:hypothetical protein